MPAQALGNLVGLQATADAGTLKGRTMFGQAVEIPLAELVSLDVLQGKAAYLADLKPKKVESAGFLGTAWPWQADRTDVRAWWACHATPSWIAKSRHPV